jgi:hypothetical protein
LSLVGKLRKFSSRWFKTAEEADLMASERMESQQSGRTIMTSSVECHPRPGGLDVSDDLYVVDSQREPVVSVDGSLAHDQNICRDRRRVSTGSRRQVMALLGQSNERSRASIKVERGSIGESVQREEVTRLPRRFEGSQSTDQGLLLRRPSVPGLESIPFHTGLPIFNVTERDQQHEC